MERLGRSPAVLLWEERSCPPLEAVACLMDPAARALFCTDIHAAVFRPWFFQGASDGALEGAASESNVWRLSAPRSAVFARNSGLSAKAGTMDGVRRFPEGGRFRFVICHRAPWRWWTEGFAFRTVSSRRTMPTHPPDRPPCVPHRHARRAVRGMKRKARSDARRFPRVAGGRPFSAGPLGDGLRPSLAKSADPASPRRLAVYPWRDGGL
jgi:hypothetical protein